MSSDATLLDELGGPPLTGERNEKIEALAQSALAKVEEYENARAFMKGPLLRKPDERKRRRLEQRASRRANRD